MRSPLFYLNNPGGPAAIVNAGLFPGNVLFVDSSNTAKSDAAGNGQNPDAPLATLAFALTQCTANKGDTIFLMPGHAESIISAAALAINIAGVRIVALGKGAKRATFTYTTATTATATITAADVHVENVLFVNGIDALANMITISAADVTLESCEIRDNNASFACTNAIVTTAGADRLKILNHVHRANGGKTGAATQISLVGGDGAIIIPRLMDGDCSTANIQNVTTACTDCRIFGTADHPAYIRNRNAAKVCITMVSTSTGAIGPNIYERIASAGAANVTNANVGAAMDFYQPIAVVNTGGTVGLNTTITASANS